jgi:P4 family phage/plasmid primase-like protien
LGHPGDRIRTIKERINVIDYARNILNLPIVRDGDRCCSLMGGNNPTALVMHENYFFDFKMGEGGDVIDLCAIARHGGDRGAAIRELAGDAGYKQWADYTQNLNNKIAYWHSRLREEDRAYLHGRRITDETINTLRIGFDGSRLVIPYYKNGYVAYYVSRQLKDDGSPKYKKAKLDGYMENIPWGLDTISRKDCDVLVITEGVFDAMSFYQEGYKVLSPMAGFFSKDAAKQVLDICRHEEKVFLCFDSDDAGGKFQMNMAKSLFKKKVNFLMGQITGYKDISEYYADEGDLRALIDTAQNGVEMLFRRITDKEEFKKFVFEAARFVGKPELVELFDFTQFPKTWLEQVKKQAMSAPPEDLIVKEVTAAKRLKYFDALGFYEYTGGVWRKRWDSEIKAYIADIYGHYRTGPRVASVFSLLKAECVSTEEMNKKMIFNFRNCTLDLETGEAGEHRESDMSSIQVDYDYDPDAFSRDWQQYLEEVTCEDESKMTLLQEIAGYVLFPDCSLQKCFFLMGEGSNGKSVFLDVLTELYGKNNVSTVEMSGLAEPFQRIHLLNSLVNISSEVKSDVRGTESVFKQIVVGDAINGCYKGKDFITFRPRTKMIAAFNRYFRANDTSTGFMRRIVFVTFNAKFVFDNPSEGEYKADIHLTAKLNKELSAIFNWAYEGYKLLIESNKFTVTSDQQEIMDGFIRITNPLMAFAEDEKARLFGRIINSDLYKLYSDWCREAGHKPMGRIIFIQRFKQTLTQMKIKFTLSKSGSDRCFIFP